LAVYLTNFGSSNESSQQGYSLSFKIVLQILSTNDLAKSNASPGFYSTARLRAIIVFSICTAPAEISNISLAP
jgi:hypothetical protein